ncbi:MAG: hypothetical protein EXR69_04440 [Myxococcales bacterium]|nr:hypothetical protein [Myxococcales bacterium]
MLNIAEGRAHFRIPAGSAAERGAALDLIGSPEAQAEQPKLRRVGAMLRPPFPEFLVPPADATAPQ